MTPSPPEARPLRDLYHDYILADGPLEYEEWLEVELRELQESNERLREKFREAWKLGPAHG